jgi:hypothetical protein
VTVYIVTRRRIGLPRESASIPHSVHIGFEVHQSNRCKMAEADHQPQSSARLKNTWSYNSDPHTSSCRSEQISTEKILPYPEDGGSRFLRNSYLNTTLAV